MVAVVLCGPTNTAPDVIVGPFATLAQATNWADAQPGTPARYAVAMSVTSPEQATSD